MYLVSTMECSSSNVERSKTYVSDGESLAALIQATVEESMEPRNDVVGTRFCWWGGSSLAAHHLSLAPRTAWSLRLQLPRFPPQC